MTRPSLLPAIIEDLVDRIVAVIARGVAEHLREASDQMAREIEELRAEFRDLAAQIEAARPEQPRNGLLRVREVSRLTGLSRSTIYRLEGEGRFPRRRRTGAKAVAWLEAEVREWIGETAKTK